MRAGVNRLSRKRPHFFRSLFSRGGGGAKHSFPRLEERHRRLICEPLEERQMLSASVATVTPSVNVITDLNVAETQPAFALLIHYDQAMDPQYAPTVSFSEDVSSTLAYNASTAGRRFTTDPNRRTSTT